MDVLRDDERGSARVATDAAPSQHLPASPPVEDLPHGYPEHWAGDVVLRDGGTCHIRPIVPADRDALQAFHMAQSDRSTYLRFFAPLPRLSERDLDRFTRVDYRERAALVAIVSERIAGVGRYDVIDPGEAEVAFNIADSQQGRGVGSVLLEHLADAARERGVRRFVAEVLPENRKMVSVFTEAGYEVSHHFDDGVISLEFDIEPTTKSMAVIASRERRAEAASLRALLTARSVAVIGASDAPDSVGRVIVQHLQRGDFRGSVYPVHPRAETVCGLAVHRHIADIGEQVDIAVVAVDAKDVFAVAAQCGAAGVRGIVVLTDGFTGERGRAVEKDLVRMSRGAGMRVLGPASLGLVNTAADVQLNASVIPIELRAGSLAVFSQSAGLGLVLLAEAHERGLGFSSVVSAGDRADVSGNDLLQFWAEDERTSVIAMYSESSGNPRKFSRIARAVSAVKPIVMVRSWADSMAAFSLTGRESGAPREAFEALLNQAGVIRAADVHHLTDVVHLLMTQPLPRGQRVGVVTNSDVLGSLVREVCTVQGLSVDEVRSVRPLTAARLAEALAEIVDGDEADSVVVALVPPLAGFDADVSAAVQAAADGRVPVLACFVASQVLSTGREELGRVPLYVTPEDGIRALASVTRYARWRSRDFGDPVDPPDCHPERAREIVSAVLAAAPDRDGVELDPATTRELLGCYGIEMVPVRTATDVEAAVAAASGLGFPVALKYVDQTLRERRDVTGAVLGIDDEERLIAQVEEMLALDDPAVADGLIVQPMVAAGVPVDIRTVEDPLFGPILSFGLTGDASDLLGDVAYRIPPLTDVDVVDVVREIKAAPRLFGHGGSARLDIEGLQELISRVARLSEDLPEVARLDLRPIVVGVESVEPLWCRVRVAPPPNRVDTGLVRRL